MSGSKDKPQSREALKASLEPARWGGVWKLLAFFGITGLLAFGLDAAITAGLRSLRTGAHGSLNKIMSGAVNADVVISGSSRALVHYDPQIIAKLTGCSAYNIGRNGSHTDMQLALLKAYLKRNRKPALIIQNLDLHSFELTRELYEPIQYLPFLSDPDIYQAIKHIEPAVWKWKWLPLYACSVEDMRFTWIQGLRGFLGLQPAEYLIQGYEPRDKQWTGDFEAFKALHQKGVQAPITPEGVKAVEAIASLCRDQGIQILFIYSPEYREMQALTTNRTEIMDEFMSIARTHGARFLDFSQSPISSNRELFYNSQHLNRDGSAAFSTDLARQLVPLLQSSRGKAVRKSGSS